MYRIVKKEALKPTVTLYEIEAPMVAKKAEPGQFIILRVDENGERIPITIHDFDREKGTVTIIVQTVGATTEKLSHMKEGDSLQDFVGPLGKATETEELRVSRFASVGLGLVAILLGIVFEKMNVAFMVALAFGIAASANFPVLILSMYWRGLTTRGAIAGGYAGLVAAVLLVVLSKSVWVTVLGNAQALFPYDQPALFSMPLAFLITFIVSKLDNSAEAQAERAAFEDQYVRAQTGFGAAEASSH